MSRCRGTLGLVSWLLLPGLAWSAGEVVANMGEVRLTVSAWRQLVQSLSTAEQEQLRTDPAMRDRLLREELIKQAILQKARQEGVDRQPAARFLMQRAGEQALLAHYMAMRHKSAEAPEEAAIRALHDQTRLRKPDRVHLLQIFVARPQSREGWQENQRRVAQIRERLEREVFADLARTFSEHKESASQGGDLGWVAITSIQPELRPVILGLQPDEISQVVLTDQGWHVFKLVAREEGEAATLEEARPLLVEILTRTRTRERENTFMQDLLQHTPITLHPEALGKFSQ